MNLPLVSVYLTMEPTFFFDQQSLSLALLHALALAIPKVENS